MNLNNHQAKCHPEKDLSNSDPNTNSSDPSTNTSDPENRMQIQRERRQIRIAIRSERMIDLPRVVERADLVGVERDRISVLVAVIGAVRPHGGGETADQKRENQNREEVFHGWSSLCGTTKKTKKKKSRREDKTEEMKEVELINE